jgi:hypothetical protein
MKIKLSRQVGICCIIATLGLSACDSSQSGSTPTAVSPPAVTPNNSTAPAQGAPQGQNGSSSGAPLTGAASGPVSGKEVQFTTFGIQYAYDQDKAWALTFSVSGPDLSAGNPVYLVAWRLYDKARQSYLTDWEISEKNPEGVSYPGTIPFTFAVRDANQVAKVINAQDNAILLLSINGSEESLNTTHYINIGANCTAHPDHFLNLSDGKNGCEQVTVALPATPSPVLSNVALGNSAHYFFVKCAIDKAVSLTPDQSMVFATFKLSGSNNTSNVNNIATLVFITQSPGGVRTIRNLAITSTDPAGWQYVQDQWGQFSAYTKFASSTAILTAQSGTAQPINVDVSTCN